MSEPSTVKLVESREVYSCFAFRVREDVIEARGRRLNRQIVVHPGAVAAVPVLPDGRIVMVRQYRHGIRDFLLEVPAGTLEAGEAPEACARREVEEEAGYRAGRMLPLGPYYPSPGICTEIIHLYAALDLTEVGAHPEPDEDLAVEFHPLDELLAMVADGRLRDGKTMVSLIKWRMRGAK